METATDVCINCSKSLGSAPYCSSCGQRHPPKKISIVNLYYDFQARIYGFDGMFLQSMRDLTLRPGRVARSFVSGIRVKYIGPVGYYFLMITLYFLLMSWLDIDFMEMSNASQPFTVEQSAAQQKVSLSFMEIFLKNFRIFLSFHLIITGLWCLLLFRKRGYNYLEHLVLIFYTQGHFYWVSMLLLVLYKFTGSTLMYYALFGGFLFYGYGAMDFYKGKKIGLLLKGVLVQVLGYVSYIIVFATFFILYMILNPEFVEQIKKMSQPDGT